jgi:hypothetical protein
LIRVEWDLNIVQSYNKRIRMRSEQVSRLLTNPKEVCR